MPANLAWKLDAVAALFFVTVAGTVAAAAGFRRGGVRLLAPLVVSVTGFFALAVVQAVLTIEWADAVPGTPGWLIAFSVLPFALLVPPLLLLVCATGVSTRRD